MIVTPQLSSPVSAQAPSCGAPVTAAPTGPATVSAASNAYGTVLVIGSGEYSGCSLYLLTTDEMHTLTSGKAPFACTDSTANAFKASCDAVLWPALLTDGAPIAGSGVNPALLGTVARTDVLPGTPVAAGDLRGPTALPGHPRRRPRADDRGNHVRPGDLPPGRVVPGRAEPEAVPRPGRP